MASKQFDPRMLGMPGYRDPLSHGGFGGFSGPGGQFSAMGAIPTQGMGGGGGGGLGIGGTLRSIADYFTDEEQGLQRTNLLLGGLGLLSDVYGSYQAGKERDREREREEEERKRREQRNASLAPTRRAILQDLTSDG